MTSRLPDPVWIVSTYYLNKIWNRVYEAAMIAFGDNKYTSLPDAYRTYSMNFVNAIHIKNPKSLAELQSYYCRYMKLDNLYQTFIKSFGAKCCPPGTSMDYSKVEELVYQIIKKAVSRFIVFSIDNLAHMSAHEDTAKMVEWQSYLHDLFISEINTFCSLIISKQTGTSTRQLDGSSIKIVSGMNDKIKAVTAQLTQLTKENERLKQTIHELEAKLAEPVVPTKAIDPTEFFEFGTDKDPANINDEHGKVADQ